MKRRTFLRAGFILVSCVLGAGSAGAQGARDLKTVDVCKVVPGSAVAAAVGGALAETRPFTPKDPTFSRCTYFIDVSEKGQTARKGYTLWFYPPPDFKALREFTEGKIVDISGLGDAAYGFLDPGDGRYKIRVLKRGDVCFEVTADAEDAARKVAGAAMLVLGKGK